MKKIMPLILLTCAFVLLLSPLAVLAQDTTGGLQDITKQLDVVGEAAYGTKQAPSLPQLIGKYINIFLGILGVLFVVLIVYGGYTWMTSYGNEQKVTKAKNLIVDAIIGLIIILAAYAISNFVVAGLVKATVGT